MFLMANVEKQGMLKAGGLNGTKSLQTDRRSYEWRLAAEITTSRLCTRAEI